jgi:hypothetical protein
VCDALALFIEKYEEEFEPFLAPFVGATWQLLTRASKEEVCIVVVVDVC